jgi:outer membrane protein
MRFLAAAVLMCSVSAPALAQVSQDTLAEAVDSAIGNNPELMAQRKARAFADENLNQAEAQMGPQLNLNGSLGVEYTTVGRQVTSASGTFPYDGEQQRATLGLQARQSLWSGGSLTAQRDQAMAGVTAAQAELIGAEQNLVLQVVTVFMDVRRAEREVEIRGRNVTSLGQQVKAARDRFDVGDVTRTDVAQAEAREGASKAELAAATSRRARARADYEQVIGRPPVQLAAPPPTPVLPASLDEAIAVARANNPAVAAARAREAQSERGVDIARGRLAPQFDLVGNAGFVESRQDDTFRDSNVGLVAEFRFPLFDSGLLQSRTRGAQLEADRARYERMAVERSITAQVTASWNQLIAAREEIAASTSRVSAAEIALEGAEQELAVGERITLDVLDQERELLEAQLGQVDAERAAYMAAHELLAAMGELRPELISEQ